MGVRVHPAELRRWHSEGLVRVPPAPSRPPKSPLSAAPGVTKPPAVPDGAVRSGAAPPPWRVTLTLPGLGLTSRSNAREHWTTRRRRDRAEEVAVRLAWAGAGLGGWHPPLPLTVVMVRLGGKPMDDDNLGGAFKALRDALAELLGVDDGDPRVRWRPRQSPGPARSVRISITPKTDTPTAKERDRD